MRMMSDLLKIQRIILSAFLVTALVIQSFPAFPSLPVQDMGKWERNNQEWTLVLPHRSRSKSRRLTEK